MSKQRRRFSAEFKFRVAMEAAKSQKTLNELASEYSVHPNQISQWKQELLKGGASLHQQTQPGAARTGGATGRALRTDWATQACPELVEGMELEWLKKICPLRVRSGVA